jgi:hypothetical protein
MRTKVFSYKGVVGIKSDVKADGLLNDPKKSGQLGFVVDASCVDISSEALVLLKTVPKSSDDIGEVDVFQASDKKVVFSWLGGPWKSFRPEDVSSSGTYDPSLLRASVEVVEIPQDFIDYVDKEQL